MSCQGMEERLDDWVDGTLPDAEAALLQEHLASCAACRESERRLRKLLAHAAALPRSVAPPRDLWPGVERQIAGRRLLSGLFGWTPSMTLAAAATAVLAIGAALWALRAPTPPQTAEIPAASPSVQVVSAGAGRAGFDPVLAQAEQDYENAANALLRALQDRRDAMAPEDFARLQANLQVIDRALAEVREALAKDPGNPELNRMLVSTHRKKVDVLRRVVRLSTVL